MVSPRAWLAVTTHSLGFLGFSPDIDGRTQGEADDSINRLTEKDGILNKCVDWSHVGASSTPCSRWLFDLQGLLRRWGIRIVNKFRFHTWRGWAEVGHVLKLKAARSLAQRRLSCCRVASSAKIQSSVLLLSRAKSWRLSPKTRAARAYSCESVALNTPMSSVHSASGWLAWPMWGDVGCERRAKKKKGEKKGANRQEATQVVVFNGRHGAAAHIGRQADLKSPVCV